MNFCLAYKRSFKFHRIFVVKFSHCLLIYKLKLIESSLHINNLGVYIYNFVQEGYFNLLHSPEYIIIMLFEWKFD